MLIEDWTVYESWYFDSKICKVEEDEPATINDASCFQYKQKFYELNKSDRVLGVIIRSTSTYVQNSQWFEFLL